MPQHIRPKTKVKVVPKEGELEITLNINISVDGKVSATSDDAKVEEVHEEKKEEKTPFVVPDFKSGLKLPFGKQQK